MNPCRSCGAERPAAAENAAYNDCPHCGDRILGHDTPAVEDLNNLCRSCRHPIAPEHDDFGCRMAGCGCAVSGATAIDYIQRVMPNAGENKNGVAPCRACLSSGRARDGAKTITKGDVAHVVIKEGQGHVEVACGDESACPCQNAVHPERSNAIPESAWKNPSDYADGYCKTCDYGTPGFHKPDCAILKREQAAYDKLWRAEKRNAGTIAKTWAAMDERDRVQIADRAGVHKNYGYVVQWDAIPAEVRQKIEPVVKQAVPSFDNADATKLEGWECPKKPGQKCDLQEEPGGDDNKGYWFKCLRCGKRVSIPGRENANAGRRYRFKDVQGEIIEVEAMSDQEAWTKLSEQTATPQADMRAMGVKMLANDGEDKADAGQVAVLAEAIQHEAAEIEARNAYCDACDRTDEDCVCAENAGGECELCGRRAPKLEKRQIGSPNSAMLVCADGKGCDTDEHGRPGSGAPKANAGLYNSASGREAVGAARYGSQP